MIMNIFTRRNRISFIFLLIAAFSQAQTDVLTQHNDQSRTGWYQGETILNPSNVTPTNFGLLYKKTVDDQIYAQPLVVNGVTIAGVSRNLVIIATVSNTIYAFDADDGTVDPYWKRNFTPAGQIPPNAGDIHPALCSGTYDDIYKSSRATGQESSFGIIGTPVIDKASSTLYFVFRSRDLSVDNSVHNPDTDYPSTGFYQWFHAIDLATGNDKFGPPVLIDPATTIVNGTGQGNNNGVISFDPRRENQRSALTLVNGVVYIPYAGHCDWDNYYGWVLGYSASNPANQVVRYVTAPNSERGGVWMSGAGPAADVNGNLFFAVGNGGYNTQASDAGNVSLSVVKATPDLVNHTLTNTAAFQPTSYSAWNNTDLDFGTGVVLIPGSNMVVTAHKTGKIMVVNQNANSGKYNENDGTNYLGSYDLGVGGGAQSHSSLTYFGAAAGQWLYQFSEYTNVKAYPVNLAAGTLGTPVTNTSVPTNAGLLGGYLSVSSNGTDANSGILWVSHYTSSGGAVHALKASDITQELWNSDASPADQLGDFAKMNCVTVADGKLFAPTFTNTLNVYGLLTSNNRCINNVALNKTAQFSSQDATNTAANAFDGQLNTHWSVGNTTQDSYIGVDLGGRFDICKIRIEWNSTADYGKNFTVDVSDDGTTWNTAVWSTLQTITGNTFATGDPLFNEFNEHTTARFVRLSVPQQGNLSVAELLVYGSPASNCVPPSVASLTATNITQNSATLNWAAVTGALNYIVKYRGPTVTSYITKIIPASTSPLKLDIAALTCGYNYEFDVQTDCGSGVLSAAAIQTFTTSACTNPCVNLTRFYHGDLGDIQAPGNACYNDPTFTVTGAGNGIGATSDQFQFNYTALTKDEDYIMHVASQDNLGTGLNQAGIMMRDSVTDISRFIYMGKTGNGQFLQMIYRTDPGAAAITSAIPNSSASNYYRILKVGTTYSAFYGNSPTGPWTAMGATQDLNFGSQQIYIGMAVAAVYNANPLVTSMATFDNLAEATTPLPVQLLNFNASVIQDKYVSLDWQTSQEENSDYFDVERSIDGTTFFKIDSVKAAGNSSTLLSYSSADNKPVRGINFYRLKQVDLDGHFVYSSVKIVKFGTASTVTPVVYPNPVSSVFTAVPGLELIREIVVYNSQGRAVQFAMGNSTEEEMKVNVSALSAGVYILKIKTDSQIYQYKIIKN
jgi:F5/8 type C domain/Secretion system C-terminal sorting domain